ncbi:MULTISPECIES: DUF6113 family protein [unclassified Streptomyces]|uniref:DUF6113 family protein n=1 Tax=unclassified Streptomyces TaxID=2593676 RepID=UPI00224FBA20|nr:MULTISPECIES: DUF6113 family protein [unclassified Streptomyces]WSP57312.1 DUF6113 family protein [Streptomyces sp. NBC_01241]WSU21969.1 DUF6113 family protein [Streptomyces sp. NBC_01108]MCX4789131.1 DUF6113 family protein [Streptomyces sp. NBC_01221]MCX4795123.1 DUF6113 family protein [Streptomyces sp. NBC_01242]WSJ36427.1 DUF6113 family protein [Streptomyces sp. NBC_01321]
MSDGKQRTPRTGTPAKGTAATGLAAPLNPGRIAAYVGLAVLGALVGIAGALVQAAWFPAGLLLALAACAGLFYGGRCVFGTQLGALAPAAGWLISVVVLLGGRPEGDYVFGDELGLTLFMLGGMVVAVICATMSRSPRTDADSGRPGK